MAERCPDCGTLIGRAMRQVATLRSRIVQLEPRAEALEQAANGEEVRCLVSEQPGVYECRLDSLCAGCRARGRIAKLEAEVARLTRELGHAERLLVTFEVENLKLDGRRREGRQLLARMVKYCREDKATTARTTRLERLVEQVADYLQRTHEPRDILREKESEDG